MKSRSYTLLESLGYAVATKVLGLFILLASWALVFPLILLWRKTDIEAFGILAMIILLLGLCAAIFASKEIVARMAEDKSMSLWLATTHTWYRYLLYLAFIPIIGTFFERIIERRKRKNPFVVDDDPKA
jgi:hypothetical protein